MRIAVLGHRGMLGRRVMEQFPEAVTFEHRYTGEPDDPLLQAIEAESPDWVINCMGALDHEPDLWTVNAGLPHRLALRWRLLQPSTDHIHDHTDYARSKRLGEAGCVIRCAIVDPEGGMLARAREADTTGEVQREWNGITAKAWARLARDLTTSQHLVPGTRFPVHVWPGSPTINHHDLLETARRVFGWPTRTLRSSRRWWKVTTPTVMLPPIETQLREYL